MIDPKLEAEFQMLLMRIRDDRPYGPILRAFRSGIEELERDAGRYRALRDAVESPRWYRLSKLGRYVELQRTDIGWGVPNGKGGWYRTLDDAIDGYMTRQS